MLRGTLRGVKNLGTFEHFYSIRATVRASKNSWLLTCPEKQVDIPGHCFTLRGRVPQTRTTGHVSPRYYGE